MRKLLERILSINSAPVIVVLLVLRYLFRFSSLVAVDIIQGCLYLLALGTLTATVGLTRSRGDLKSRPWQLILSLLFLAGLVLTVVNRGTAGNLHEWTAAWVSNAYLGAMAFITISGHLILLARRTSPALVLPSSFIVVILVGTALLLAPRSTEQGGISPVDALFTSTSATCVTGLIVKDTETDFTFQGQLIILLLIQVGGLGLMTFAAFFSLTFGQNIGLSDTMNLTRIMDTEFASDLKHILVSILLWTLTIEAAGAVLLYNTWSGLETGWSTGETIWQSIFHSISAFCNAGFSLNSNNLEGFSHSPETGLIIGSLIVLGGLGFMLLTVLGKSWLNRIKTGRKRPLPVQARFVLLSTGILVALALLFFIGAEWNNTLRGMTIPQKLGNGFLEAVTPRTAGFNTVPTSELLPSVKWFFVILMFVGASPGGTGGGVKTTSVGLLFLSLRSLLQRKKQPEIWRRRIPAFDLQRAGAVLLMGMATFGVSSMLLLITENSTGQFQESDYIFEAMSAFGTVGLSTGVTSVLTTPGRWIIIVTMFIGRTAPATLAAATIRCVPHRTATRRTG